MWRGNTYSNENKCRKKQKEKLKNKLIYFIKTASVCIDYV